MCNFSGNKHKCSLTETYVKSLFLLRGTRVSVLKQKLYLIQNHFSMLCVL